MIEMALLVAFLEASVRFAVPLGLAALGETIAERAGVLNLGLEGAIISGALGGALGSIAFESAGMAFTSLMLALDFSTIEA